ncbi:MAG: thiamine pyrophosphate-binding protein [Streptosporangiales bacterium]|nr:thiamine pyrophosphate-binding protein [Streptosporangiales bacterium]
MTGNAGDAVVELLAAAGVRRFYTVPGESFLELIDAAHRHPDITLVSTRHESGAAFMAEAEGKLTGRPAVALGTRAVGASNLAIGVHTARQDSTPMLVLLGQVETPHLGKEAFQEVDLPRFFAEITTYATTVTRADRAAATVGEALRRSTLGRPGPAMVAFPADVLAGECPPAAVPVPTPPSPRPSPAEVTAVAAALADAERPVAILGRGAHDLHDPLVRLAEAYGLGVYAGFRRQDAFPNSHQNYLGHLGLGTPPPLLEPLRAADLVLALGCRLSEITTQAYALPAPGARVIQVDVAAESIGAVVPVERGVVATVEAFADALLDRPVEPHRRDWTRAHRTYLDLSDPDGYTTEHGVHPAQVVAAMHRQLPDDVVLTSDAGNFSVFGHSYWRFEHARTQLAPTSGAMGYGLPAAIGAALAEPHRNAVALCGDGGFLMTGQELETASRMGAPVLTIVFQNGLYGTIALHQARANGRPSAVDIGPVDVAGYARALGAEAATVNTADELDEQLAAAKDFDRPRVLAVRTDPDVLTPAARMSELLGERG